MEAKQALDIATKYAAQHGETLTHVEWNCFEYGNWIFWIDGTNGKKWGFAVDDLDADVLMMPGREVLPTGQ
jgi:hypothetical protein